MSHRRLKLLAATLVVGFAAFLYVAYPEIVVGSDGSVAQGAQTFDTTASFSEAQAFLEQEAIEDPCPASNHALDGPIELNIKIPNSGRWVQNIWSAHLDPRVAIAPEFKRPFRAQILLGSIVDKRCVFDAEVGLSGDWRDHLQERAGSLVSSLDVKLLSGNIGSIVRFKLLLPETRGGASEIATTELLRDLGFIAPRTRFASVAVNGEPKLTYLLQEKPAKEMLEFHQLRESAIVEADETLIWGPRSGEGGSEVTSAKIVNISWASRTDVSAQIGVQATGLLANSLKALGEYELDLEGSEFPLPDLKAQANQSPSNLQYLIDFEFVNAALKLEHGLIHHNRKYYFDPVSDALLPIYLDGNPWILSAGFTPRSTFLNGPISSNPSSHIIERVNSLDTAQLNEKLRKFGAGENSAALELLRNNLFTALQNSSAKEFVNENKFVALNAWATHSQTHRLVRSSGRDFEVCSASGHDCLPRIFSQPELLEMLDGRLVIGGIRHVFYELTDSRLPDLKTVNLPGMATGDFKLLAKGDVSFNYLVSQQILQLVRHSDSARFLITGSLPIGLHITMADSYEVAPEKIESRFDEDLLTSCLTIYKANITNLVLETVGGSCEDSVNFLNSEGTVDRLSIDSSLEDSLDMDFSIIEIRELLVTNAGNDCLDLSDGTYKVQSLEAVGCLDKAISIGERAKVNIETAHLRDSAVGIAVKDFASVHITNARVKNTKVCLAGYRKKQEFGGANLSINPAACESGSTIFQRGSFLAYMAPGSLND